jgi:hypothetical protein
MGQNLGEQTEIQTDRNTDRQIWQADGWVEEQTDRQIRLVVARTIGE